MNMITLGIAMSVAEFLIFGYRLFIIYKYRDRMKGDYQNEQTP